jgi:hypothetical protein
VVQRNLLLSWEIILRNVGGLKIKTHAHQSKKTGRNLIHKRGTSDKNRLLAWHPAIWPWVISLQLWIEIYNLLLNCCCCCYCCISELTLDVKEPQDSVSWEGKNPNFWAYQGNNIIGGHFHLIQANPQTQKRSPFSIFNLVGKIWRKKTRNLLCIGHLELGILVLLLPPLSLLQ